MTVSSKIPNPRNAIVLYGEKGTLAAVETLISQMSAAIPPMGRLETTTAAGTVVDDGFENRDIFQAELDAFSKAVAAGTEPEIGARDGIRAQEIALAMQRSFREGVTVSLKSEDAL
jgi:predicted dehydrogenase